MKRSLVTALIIGVAVAAVVSALHASRLILGFETAAGTIVSDYTGATRVVSEKLQYVFVLLLALGVAWLEPGQISRWWSFEQEDQKRPDESFQGWHHETYFVVRGRLKLSWNEGELDLAPNDAVYLAPGWHYRLENVGDDQAFFVYNVYPTTK